MKKSPAAFTLVELLVVITIIAVLAGIALPVFAKVQENAKASTEASNLRQLGIAIRGYMTDNNNDLLDAAKTPVDALYPTYIATYKIFKSPFDLNPTSDVKTAAQISFVMNGIRDGTGTSAQDILGIDSSKITYPTNLLLMVPNVIAGGSTSQAKFPVLLASNAAPASFKMVAVPSNTPVLGTNRNRTLISVLYADGHTENLLFKKFANTATASGTNTDDGQKRWYWNDKQ